MLKSLELFGFKSFADRVAFDLVEGITCVVGPNGSGKSNVVDAIKWLLGDQSPKSLRGKEMTDVIFNGSQAAKPSGFAEAILTFNNSNGLLDIESDEVRIGRRLYRGGDSEYLLNDNVVRLKDIRDLLMGTGAGLSAYNIIEQGRVGQILQANPTSRRVIFEEAAGISRFKTRKQDGERKLERVAQNLQRLQDIVDEVESQLNATRSQASKAAKYREVSVELERWFLGLAADDYRRISDVRGELDAELVALATSQTELREQQEALEAQNTQHKDQLEHVRRQLNDEVRLLSTFREQIADRRANLRHSQSRSDDLQRQHSQLQEDRRVASSGFAQVLAEWQTSQADLSQFEQQLEEQEAEHNKAEDDVHSITDMIRELDEELQQLRKQSREHEQAIFETERLIQNYKEQRETIAAARERTSEELAQLETKLVSETETLTTLQSDLDQATREHQEEQQALDELSAQANELDRANRELAQQLSQVREERSALQARQAILQELESKQAGMTVGVKDFLERAAKLNHAPWNSIVGTVVDLIEVDLLDAALAEVALGERAQWIVVEQLKPILEYLDRETPNIVGRVGFFPLHDEQQNGIPTIRAYGTLQFEDARPTFASAELQAEPGVLSSAETLLTANTIADSSFTSRILGDTWIVEDLPTAQRLARTGKYSNRFVTLQGELVERNGAIVVGNQQVETSVISRRSELLKLRQKLADIELNITNLQDQITANETQIAELHHARSVQENAIQSRSSSLSEQRSDVQNQQQQCLRIREDRDRVKLNLERMDAQLSELDQKRIDAESRHAEATAEKHQSDSAVEKHEQQTTEANTERRSLIEQSGRLKLELVRNRQQLVSIVETTERLSVEKTRQEQRVAQLDEHYSDIVDSCRLTTLKVLNTRAELDELHGAIESRHAITVDLQSQYDDSEQVLKQADKEFQNVSKELRKTESRIHTLEMTRRDHDNDLKNLEERLADEYQLSLEDLADSEHSAFQLYLEERGLAPAVEVEETDDEQAEESAADDYSEYDEMNSEDMITEDTSEIQETETETSEELAPDPGITYEDVRDEIEERVARLRRRIKSLGNVNSDSLHDLEELETRFEKLSAQLNDLVEAKNTLEDIVRRISHESKRLFIETYESIRGNFQVLFRKMFGGGEGDVILEDPEDPLDCGIEIIARPPGKELRSISLLSGGEKTMTAVALLLAMFKSKPSPFCILDEVDAALDEANIDRYIRTLREFKDETQFVMITHRKRTMTVADRMYGVTMEQSGISKKLTVSFEDVTDNGEIHVGGKDTGSSDTQAA